MVFFQKIVFVRAAPMLFLLLFSNGVGAAERWNVEKIQFTGNKAISELDLLRSIKTRPPRTIFPKRFDLFVLDEDLERIETLYRSRGFPFARATIEDIERISAGRRVIITVNIYEGELYIVDSLGFCHLNVITEDELKKFIQLVPGKPLDPSMVQSDMRLIRDNLRAMGYLQANVRSVQMLNMEKKTAKIIHTIEEGPLIKAGSLLITGLKQVKTTVIKREVAFDSGTVLTSAHINKSIVNIYSTALFDFVKIYPDTSRKSMKEDTATLPVNINVKETPEYSFQIGIGYETDRRTFLNGDAEYGNLFGTGHRVSLMGYISQPQRRLQLTYSWPWFLNRQLWANFSVFANRWDDEFLKGTSNGSVIALRGNITPDWIYNIWSTVERTRFSEIGIPEERLIARPIPTNQLFALALVNDTRKGIFFPGLSRFGMIQAEIAGLTGIGNQYTRYILDLRSYFPFSNDKFLLSFALYSAVAVPYGKDEFVPQRELFRTSESSTRTIRGYNMRDLSDLNDEPDLITGGNFILVFNIFELNYYFTTSFMTSVFSDAGFIWENFSTRTPAVFSVGIGIRHSLPIGLLRVDYGLGIAPKINFPGKLYLSLGLPF
ncbi:MAG: BamA/TamA family outer membrane protein [Chitinispirillales bacterium]|jgi:outer membrane protein insertion porin family|nr:BamA/TamA family outer membrane protein [Chitinispirillales bacterium]